MSVEEQIANLKGIGLTIKDEDKAKQILSDISYFRLIKAFSLQMKEKNGNYREGVCFEQIVELYLFNANLRQLIFPEIERIEVNAGYRISNYFADIYGVLGYLNRDNFVDEKYYEQFIRDIEDEIGRNSRAPFVKNFRENYDSGDLPIYALFEVCSFGTLSKFYKNMKNTDKKAISNSFGVGYTYYESWIEAITYVRNICAHYGRLYNAILSKRPMIYKQYMEAGIPNNRLFAVLLCMKRLVPHDVHWGNFVKDMESLINKYSNININSMGFPTNWKQLLEE